MSDNQQAPVELPSPRPEDEGSQDQHSKSVSYESHRRLLDEKKKLDARLKEIEDEKKAAQEAKLLEEGKLKEALELREKELQEERSKRMGYEEQHKNAKKLNAIVKGLGSNVDDKWYPVIGDSLDYVEIDDQGTVNMKSVNEVVEKLKKQWPEMLKKEQPGMPNGTPQGGANKITRSEWLKLPSKEMKKWKPDQII
jgi:hypothetical protein